MADNIKDLQVQLILSQNIIDDLKNKLQTNQQTLSQQQDQFQEYSLSSQKIHTEQSKKILELTLKNQTQQEQLLSKDSYAVAQQSFISQLEKQIFSYEEHVKSLQNIQLPKLEFQNKTIQQLIESAPLIQALPSYTLIAQTMDYQLASKILNANDKQLQVSSTENCENFVETEVQVSLFTIDTEVQTEDLIEASFVQSVLNSQNFEQTQFDDVCFMKNILVSKVITLRDKLCNIEFNLSKCQQIKAELQNERKLSFDLRINQAKLQKQLNQQQQKETTFYNALTELQSFFETKNQELLRRFDLLGNNLLEKIQEIYGKTKQISEQDNSTNESKATSAFSNNETLLLEQIETLKLELNLVKMKKDFILKLQSDLQEKEASFKDQLENRQKEVESLKAEVLELRAKLESRDVPNVENLLKDQDQEKHGPEQRTRGKDQNAQETRPEQAEPVATKNPDPTSGQIEQLRVQVSQLIQDLESLRETQEYYKLKYEQEKQLKTELEIEYRKRHLLFVETETLLQAKIKHLETQCNPDLAGTVPMETLKRDGQEPAAAVE